MKYIIIQGSLRSKGNTNIIVEVIRSKMQCDFIDLNQYNFDHFDYENTNENDDFSMILNKILDYDVLIFATPVYWFSMSSLIKKFIERLPIKKDVPLFKGKSMAAISCGSQEGEIDAFFVPFKNGAEYLEMNYLGNVHTWVENGQPTEKVKHLIDDFVSKIEE